ncbi:MAG: CoB--CoM heterodisulfide reductase iron-sulfur subunit B family protein [Methermicoccaceae archaeon]
MKSYSYYPGCFVEGSEAEYGDSCVKVLRRLDIEAKEIPDWNCCGALEMTTDKALTVTLSARNASIAEAIGDPCVVPCSICYNNLKKAEYEVREGTELGKLAQQALKEVGLTYNAEVPIKHLLDVLINDVGLEAIEAEVKRPLTGIKVAPFYGCLTARPSKISGFEDPVNPTSMDKILKALGAEVIENFNHKVKCCGGSTVTGDQKTSFTLTKGILDEAVAKGADCIALVCPMCHSMLDGKQTMIGKEFGVNYNIPALYLSQLLGLAMGMSESDVGLKKNIISAKGVVAKLAP